MCGVAQIDPFKAILLCSVALDCIESEDAKLIPYRLPWIALSSRVQFVEFTKDIPLLKFLLALLPVAMISLESSRIMPSSAL
jgi:hypothetical protein